MEPKQKQHPAVDVTGDGSKIDAVKSNIAYEPGMLGPRIKANWKRSNRNGKSECRHFRNGLEWVNITHMTIIPTTLGKNPLEEMN